MYQPQNNPYNMQSQYGGSYCPFCKKQDSDNDIMYRNSPLVRLAGSYTK